MSDLTGELIDGRYQLLRQVANGGMASIYEAIDIRLDRKVAVESCIRILLKMKLLYLASSRRRRQRRLYPPQYRCGAGSRVESERSSCSLFSNGAD